MPTKTSNPPENEEATTFVDGSEGTIPATSKDVSSESTSGSAEKSSDPLRGADQDENTHLERDNAMYFLLHFLIYILFFVCCSKFLFEINFCLQFC